MLYKSNKKSKNLIPPHGGYKKLESYKTAKIIHDGTAKFCEMWIKDFKLASQMIGAARSGKQCIAEGSMNSGTSKKLEIKLINNSRGSFEELLEDYEDFLRHNNLPLWSKDSKQAKKIRQLAYKSNKSYVTYQSYLENNNPEITANAMICLIHQENFLLDRLKRRLEKDFLIQGGFTERMYHTRKKARNK